MRLAEGRVVILAAVHPANEIYDMAGRGRG